MPTKIRTRQLYTVEVTDWSTNQRKPVEGFIDIRSLFDACAERDRLNDLQGGPTVGNLSYRVSVREVQA